MPVTPCRLTWRSRRDVMRIWPVFLDFVPSYVGRSGASLLLTPIGAELMVSRLLKMVERVTANVPIVVAPPDAGPAYPEAVAAVCPDAAVISAGAHLSETLLRTETSDVWLFADCRCFLAEAAQLAGLLDQFAGGRQIAHHLVAFETSISGTKEHVNIDGADRVRSVHRYYNGTTWPFVAGVAASLVPVSSSLLYLDRLPASLMDLRQHLAACGVPGRDVAVEGGAADLTSHHGLLAAMEHEVVAATAP